jgi:hypothetical protein
MRPGGTGGRIGAERHRASVRVVTGSSVPPVNAGRAALSPGALRMARANE